MTNILIKRLTQLSTGTNNIFNNSTCFFTTYYIYINTINSIVIDTVEFYIPSTS
jgi:hypothetical protein